MAAKALDTPTPIPPIMAAVAATPDTAAMYTGVLSEN